MPAFFLAPAGLPEGRAPPEDVAPRTRLGLEPTTSEERARIRRRAKLDLNRAEVRRLIQLPDIGRTIARRIVQAREKRGGFRRVEDLARVRGIGPKTLENLRPRVRVDGESAAPDRTGGPVALNRADRPTLRGLPGVGEVLADRIVRHRRRTGPYRSLDDLMSVRGIGTQTLEQLRPHLRIARDADGH